MTLHISQVGSGLGLVAVVLLSACGDGSSDSSEGGVPDGSAMDGSAVDGSTMEGGVADSGTQDAGAADGSTDSSVDGGEADASGDGALADADTDATTEDAATDAGETDGDVTDAGGDADAAGDDAGVDAPTFTDVYADIIAMKCSPCHTTSTSGNLDMSDRDTAYANLVDVLADGPACDDGERTRVIPEMPDESLLIQKLRGGADLPCGSQMPQGRAPLSEGEIADIASWIEAGAPDD